MITPPRRIFKFKFLSRGATGWVFQIDKDIALKYARHKHTDAFQHESDTYDILERHEPSPYILQSLLRRPDVNFLVFMNNGSLETRIRNNQLRDSFGNLIQVARKEPLQKVELWALELTGAAAWLESLGLVHGDLRPANLLLDCNDHLKLADFDCADIIGSRSQGSAPPWARLRGDEAGSERGTWGENGARTEQFAIGSILYTLTRGFQPYEDQELGPEAVQRLQRMDFPGLADDRLDAIIHRCWIDGYDTVKALAEEAASLEGAHSLPQAAVLGAQYITNTRERCHRLLDEGLLDETESSSVYKTVEVETIPPILRVDKAGNES